jgi:hypothetical protein
MTDALRTLNQAALCVSWFTVQGCARANCKQAGSHGSSLPSAVRNDPACAAFAQLKGGWRS